MVLKAPRVLEGLQCAGGQSGRVVREGCGTALDTQGCGQCGMEGRGGKQVSAPCLHIVGSPCGGSCGGCGHRGAGGRLSVRLFRLAARRHSCNCRGVCDGVCRARTKQRRLLHDEIAWGGGARMHWGCPLAVVACRVSEGAAVVTAWGAGLWWRGWCGGRGWRRENDSCGR